MRSLASLVALALIAGCGDPAGPATEDPGELVGAIIAGREQSVKAGASQLPEAVINQVVRTKAGSLMLLRATTQGTVANGSPVPGAVVCVYEQDKDLIPFARCTNTDALGKATFFFTPPTKAGEYIARINGSVTTNGVVEATTFDTVKAEVEPGPAVTPGSISGPTARVLWIGRKVRLADHINPLPAVDAFGNTIPLGAVTYAASAGIVLAADSFTVAAGGSQSIRAQANELDATVVFTGLADLTKGFTISSRCIDATADSVVYAQIVTAPAVQTTTTTATYTGSPAPRRIEYITGGTGTATQIVGRTASWTVTQSAGGFDAVQDGTGVLSFVDGTATESSTDGTLCPSAFTTRGRIRLTAKP